MVQTRPADGAEPIWRALKGLPEPSAQVEAEDAISEEERADPLFQALLSGIGHPAAVHSDSRARPSILPEDLKAYHDRSGYLFRLGPWQRMIRLVEFEFGSGVAQEIGYRGVVLDCKPIRRRMYAERMAEGLVRRWKLRDNDRDLLAGSVGSRDEAQLNLRKRDLALSGLLLAANDQSRSQFIRIKKDWIKDEASSRIEVAPVELSPILRVSWLAAAAKRAAISVLRDDPWPVPMSDALSDPSRIVEIDGIESLEDARNSPLDNLIFEEQLEDFQELLENVQLTPALRALLEAYLRIGDWPGTYRALNLSSSAGRERKRALLDQLRQQSRPT